MRRSVTVPSTAAPGRWYVVACADATRRVRETRESDNCRTTRAVTVRSAATATPTTTPTSITTTTSTPTQTSTPTPTPAPTGPGTFPRTPDPVTVGDPVLETARAVTRTAYPFADTTIVATAADGTTYTLVVPRDALLSAQAITMTPVSSVSGLPMSGGLRAAVQLEPHGLLLQVPATLTIDSPDLGELDEQTAFLFHEGGEDFHSYPPAMPEPGDDADVMRMRLTHFSTPGVGSGPAPGMPVRSLGQLEAAVSSLLGQERASQLAGNAPDPAVGEKVAALMRAYYDNVLVVQLSEAENDPTKAPQATAEGLGWMRQFQLIGVMDDPRYDDLVARIERIWKNAMNHYWTECVEEHELGAAPILLGIARTAALFSWAWAEEAADKAMRCANVEVRFTSSLTAEMHVTGTSGGGSGGGDGGIESADVSAAWEVASTAPVSSAGYGEGPLAHTDFRYAGSTVYAPGPSCQLVSTTTGTATSPGRMLALMHWTSTRGRSRRGRPHPRRRSRWP